MLPFILLAASLLSPQQASTECVDTGASKSATETQPVRGPSGATAMLKVSSADDHSKNSHECNAEYKLVFTPAAGAAAIEVDVDDSDGECGRLTGLAFRVYRVGMSSKPVEFSGANAPVGVVIERAGEVLNFTLDNAEHENEVAGAMFDAMLAELRREASHPSARVLRVRARGKVFCTGRERAGRDAATIHQESARLIEFKHALRISPLISVAEVQGDAFGFGFGLAIVCDFVYVAESAALGFPEMHFGLAPAAVMAYLGEYALPRFAFPLVLFGDPIAPQQAKQIGLISHVSPASTLTSDVDAVIERILRLDANAVRNCKEFFQTAQQNSFDQNCRLATEALTVGSLAVLSRQKK